MPNIVFPLTFSLAPLPTGTALNANDFANQIVANLQATISGQFLTGQIDGNAPTTNVGPWANNGHWWFWDETSSTYIQESLTSNFPSGSIISFGGIAAPTGFLLCDGASYLTSIYPTLFAVIGTNYGGGGSSFNVPNLVNAFPRGVTAESIGTTGGSDSVTLSSSQMPMHNHVINIIDGTHNHALSNNPHGHQSQYPNEVITAYNPGGSFITTIAAGILNASTSLAGIGIAPASSNISATSNNEGSSSPFTITPTYTAVTYIIKT